MHLQYDDSGYTIVNKSNWALHVIIVSICALEHMGSTSGKPKKLFRDI